MTFARTWALTSIGARLRALSGWRRVLVAVVAGAVSALGFAPFCLFLLLLLGLAAAVLLLDGAQRARRPVWAGAWVGWGFGFGQFAVGLHWIGFAFMVDAADHAWQLPFVAVLFPGGLALFPAIACAAASRFWRAGPSRIFLFALCYGLAEWARGHVLTGFPWNLAGYGWGGSLAVLQSAAAFGVYTLSLLTALFGAALAELFSDRPRWRLPVVMTVIFAAFWIGGAMRLAQHPTAFIPGVTVRLVQPDIPQAEKYRPDLVARNWERLIRLSTLPASQVPRVIVWPEAAPPFLMTYSAPAMEWVSALNARGSLLMTGAIRAEAVSFDETKYFNSFYIFARGRAVATYDKSHLVPFGEYLPFEKTLDAWGLKKLTGIAGSFGMGPGPQTLTVPGVPDVGPLICYEILFPGDVVGTRRPNWLVNVTDDSWFGTWAGPLQHLQVAQVRAIEEGLPVVRAANSGISAIIDPFGRIVTRSAMNAETVVDGRLPARTPSPTAGFQFLWFWLVVAGLFFLSVRRTGRK